MAIKKYYADKDNTITNAFRANLRTRGTGANMGLSDVLETFSIYAQQSSGSTELERILIEFPINQITADRASNIIPASGSVSFYLNMYNACSNQTLPRELKLVVLPISQSWQEGTGLDMEEYKDVTKGNVGSNWINAGQGDPWTREGGDYLTSPVYSQTFPIGNEDLEIDITPLVEDWIAGTITNYGIGVHLTSSQEAYFAEYYPREAVHFDGLAFLSGTSDTDQENDSTISAWIKQSNNTGTRYVLFWEREVDHHLRRVLQIDPAGTAITYRKMYSGGTTTITTDDSLPPNTWTHIVVTDTQDSADIPSIYINSISASATVIQGAGSALTDVDMFAIGGSRSGVSYNFNGFIDDVASFNKILSPGEITELYNGACPAPIKELSIYENLSNWWVHGDDPRDEINLGTPPTEISIYDRVGTANLYATGSGGMAIVTGSCSGQNGTVGRESDGQLINAGGAKETYYTKKFFGRGTEFFFSRPAIQARWDSSIKDDRGNFYASSSLVPAADNMRTLYLYNVIGGRLRNIPAVGTGEIYVKVYTSVSAGTDLTPTPITGGYVSLGIYSASFALDTTVSTVYDRWYSSGLTDVYHTGTFDVKQYAASTHNPYGNLVTTLTNLRSVYTTSETARFRFYERQKDWSPTIYTVATTITDTLVNESASYQVHRVIDDLIVIPYNTGSDRGTQMSFDMSGNYFDLEMDLLEPGYSYGIKIAYYNETVDSYVGQPYEWKFRVEEV